MVINLAKEGKVIESRQLLESLLRKDKRNINLLMLLAELNSKTGEFKKSVQNYRKVIQLAPGNKQAHTNLAMLYHSKGDSQKAERLYKQSLKLDNRQPVVNFNLGAVLQEQGKLEEAQQKYLNAISLEPTYAKAYSNLGYVQRLLNKLDASIDSYRKAIKHAPNVPEIFFNLGVSLLQKGIPDEAEHCQRKALQLRENYSDAWEGLGSIQLYRDDSKRAINSFKQALVCKPKCVTALCGLAKSLSMRGLNDQADDQIKQALYIEPEHIVALSTQVQIFISLGKLEEALESCNTILKHSPKEKSALSMAAVIYEKKGQADKAYTYLKPLLSKSSPDIDAVLCFASISKSIKRVDDAIAMMEDVLESRSPLHTHHRRHLHFSLGKVHDSLHNYEKAFYHYQLGNQLKQSDFNISLFRDTIDSIIKVFNTDLLAKHSLKFSSTRPVFIVGMPRSGTSLVEQILSSHPQVYGAGELQNINDIITAAPKVLGSEKPYPDCIPQAQQKDLTLLAKSYTDFINTLDPDALRITDKLPTNFFHIGLIHLLFPDAHIIHCIRDPLDTCLSCYFQDFGGDHPWIYDLEDLALVYKEYLRIMHYWQYDLGVPVYEVNYENLVENQEKISRELINYVGLEWNEQCMQFHENKRFIWTASYDQVRQPMYKKSIARWKNYSQQLTPLINILCDD